MDMGRYHDHSINFTFVFANHNKENLVNSVDIYRNYIIGIYNLVHNAGMGHCSIISKISSNTEIGMRRYFFT